MGAFLDQVSYVCLCVCSFVLQVPVRMYLLHSHPRPVLVALDVPPCAVSVCDWLHGGHLPTWAQKQKIIHAYQH